MVNLRKDSPSQLKAQAIAEIRNGNREVSLRTNRAFVALLVPASDRINTRKV